MSVANRDTIAKTLKKIPFIVVYEIFNNELTEGFADIVLPATCPLEESNLEGFVGLGFNHAFGMADWCYHIRQVVVEPKASRKQFDLVLMEIAERLGIMEKYINEVNSVWGLEPKYALKPGDKVTPEEIYNRIAKNYFGDEHDWQWFKEHGFLRWPKKAEEIYWRYFIDCRVPIYLEYLVDTREKRKEITKQIGLNADFTQYTPLISWFPCSIHKIDKPEYDLYCFSYRDVLHTSSFSQEQPYLDEASRINPYTYNISMHVDTARKKGIKDGDIIQIESINGRKVEGQVKLMEGQHPQTMGIVACSGHWAKGMPIARGKGVNFDDLLELDAEHTCPINGNIETAVRVKVRKVGTS
jgi:molybdopterin-containing oxidoreductase family molybdopterin binding subunit